MVVHLALGGKGCCVLEGRAGALHVQILFAKHEQLFDDSFPLFHFIVFRK
jgi:hypothetical protein